MSKDKYATTASGAERAAWAQKMFNSYRDLNPSITIDSEMRAALMKRLNIAEIFDTYRFENDAKWFFFMVIGDIGDESSMPIFGSFPCLAIYDNTIIRQTDTAFVYNIANDGYFFLALDFSIVIDILFEGKSGQFAGVLQNIFTPNIRQFSISQFDEVGDFQQLTKIFLGGFLNPKLETIFLLGNEPILNYAEIIAELEAGYLTKGIIPLQNLTISAQAGFAPTPPQQATIDDIEAWFIENGKVFTFSIAE